ncbi:tolloid-like protein 1 isoform X2 [Homarus americanus]|nr:tolloid-like protein 1 isoform X2 [Homarus americanus]
MMCGDKLHIILEEKEELIVNFDSDNQTLVEGECLADLRVAVKDTGIKKYGMQVEGEMDLEDPDNGELCTSSYLRVTDVDDLEDETGRINKFCNKDSIDFETIEDLVTLELSLKDIGKNKGQFMVKLMPHCLCGGLIDKTEGEIKTPLYPRPYPNILCIWVIKAALNSSIFLHFEEFNLRPRAKKHCKDYLNLNDGMGQELHCGKELQHTTKKYNVNLLILRFSSTRTQNEYSGFLGKVMFGPET